MKTLALILVVAATGYAQTSPDTQPAATPSKSNDAGAAATKSKKPAAPPKTAPQRAAAPAAPAPPPPPLLPPAGATLVEANLYRYVDPSGKVWMYRQTPFGFSKWEDTPNAGSQASAPAAADLVTVKDLGDSVRFERKTPFGATQWVRKKTELSEDEKALLAREQEKSQSTPAADTAAPARPETH